MKQVWTHWYLLVLLGVFPLWLGWTGYRALTEQKYGFFVVVTLLWLVGLAFLTVRERRCAMPKTSGRLWMPLMMAGLCLSALCSPYGMQTVIGAGRYDGLVTWLLYGCVFLGVSAYGKPRLLYAYVLAGSAVVNCVVALIQLLGYNCLWLFPADWTYYDSGVRYTGAFLGFIGNTDLLSAYFCLVIPVCFGAYVLYGGRKTAWLLPAGALCWFVLLESGVSGGLVGLALCVLIAAPLILTDRERLTRGLRVLSLLALTAGCAMACVCSADGLEIKLCKPTAVLFCAAGLLLVKPKRTLRKPQRGILCLEILCVLGALAAVYVLPPESGTLYELSRLLHGEVSDRFGSNRVGIWREVWRLVRERPIVGGGPDTLTLRTDLGFSRFVEETGRGLRVHVDNAHNEYLNLLVNGGLVSLVPYLSLLAATLRRLWRNRDNRLLCALSMPLLAWWGQAFFGLGLCIVAPLLWAGLGLFWTVDDKNIM